MDKQSAFNHQYHQTMTIKIFLADPHQYGPDVPFAEALEIIGKISHVTQGIPTIVYLIGWQFAGHDSKYPSWAEVNKRLRRPEDADAADSLRWLMREARDRYGVTVSLHTNMCIAFKNSPLWEEYERNDLISRDAEGKFVEVGVFGGEQSYMVCNAREWASGHAKRRIDALLDLLPIEQAGTIHLDWFRPTDSAFHGVEWNDAIEGSRTILKYWHSRGVDTTTEWFHHEFAGLTPMVLHLNLDEVSRLKYPAHVVCGGGSLWNTRRSKGEEWMRRTPEEGCLYPGAWGESIYGEMDIQADRHNLIPFIDSFCTAALPWHFLNRHAIRQHVVTAKTYEVHFADGVKTSVDTDTGRLTLRHEDRVLVDGTDLCMPASWQKQMYIAYSRTGGAHAWQLDDKWKDVGRAKISNLTLTGPQPIEEQPLDGGRVTLTLKPGQAVSIVPA